MKITKNPDAEIVRIVEEGLKARGGYCPCRADVREEYTQVRKETSKSWIVVASQTPGAALSQLAVKMV